MHRIACALSVFSLAILIPAGISHADLNNNYVIDRTIAQRVEELKHGASASEDFNACQITWTVAKLPKDDTHSQFQPHAITFQYEQNEIITLTNKQDGEAESIKNLGLNCLEFNEYVYLFFDTSDYETTIKFGLNDLAYVAFSSNKGKSWSELISLHSFSNKAKFIVPHGTFNKYVKIFGNRHNHAISIFNQRDETTYLLSPDLKVLKSVPVYNRLSDYLYPNDFHYHRNTIYSARGSCENVKGKIHCPARTYIETSRDFGHTWDREKFIYTKKSYFFNFGKTLYHFYFRPCKGGLFGFIPAMNKTHVCGRVEVRTLSILSEWEKPRVILNTVEDLLGVYNDGEPVLSWKDYRYHKSRACGYIPLIGCVDSDPFRGPEVTFAGKLNLETWEIDESIIEYKK